MKPDRAVRVLIVEDSPIVHAVLRRNLAAIPNVAVAGAAFTGRSGIVAIRQLEPDAVLLDLTMPDGDGFDVLTAIRGDAHQPLLVIVTFHSDETMRDRCFELGAHIFIDKARDTDRLFALLARLGSGETTVEQEKAASQPDNERGPAERHAPADLPRRPFTPPSAEPPRLRR